VRHPLKVIVWKIAPSDGRFVESEEVPPISYGVVPAGWVQEIPAAKNPPPALLDGYVYYIQAVPARGGGAEMCILLKSGKAVPYREDSVNTICGKRQ
jgi:hypothetical protein